MTGTPAARAFAMATAMVSTALVRFSSEAYPVGPSVLTRSLIMAAQALTDPNETGHLVGDIPALLLVVAVLGYLAPRKTHAAHW